MNNTQYKLFGSLCRDEQLELFAAWLDGGLLEAYDEDQGNWYDAITPRWRTNTAYRIKPVPKTKPSINWEHVDKRFKWMATDEKGETFLFSNKPGKWADYWSANNGESMFTDAFSSFIPGTCDWKDSLVERPE